jgi:AcrR family transcriptional regulator
VEAKGPSDDERRRPGRPRSEESRVQILDAAYRLLRKKGLPATLTQEIAAEAGVSTATLYRWWDTKESILLDAVIAHVERTLPYDGTGSAIARLRENALLGAAFLMSVDGQVVVRLLASIYDDPVLRKQFLENYYLPRRALERDLVVRAMSTGELPRDADPEIVIDALHGPQLFRVFMGHAPVTAEFANAVADVVLGPRR